MSSLLFLLSVYPKQVSTETVILQLFADGSEEAKGEGLSFLFPSERFVQETEERLAAAHGPRRRGVAIAVLLAH